MRTPSAGGIPAAIAKRLRSVRYAVGDIAFVAGRFLARAGQLIARVPVAVGRATKRGWFSLSVIARRRLVLAVGVALVILAFLSLAVPNLPCEFPGGDTCPPADDAAQLVPADSLAYLHVNLDLNTDEASSAADVFGRLPLLGGQIEKRALALLPGPATGRLDFDRDIAPWFAGEVAIAIVPGAGAIPERVDLLEVSDSDGAANYADSLSVGQTQSTQYQGVDVSVDQRHVATAQVQGFLVIGTEDGVRAVIDAATGTNGGESLADDQTAADVRDELPDHRFADAWLSPDGVDQLIAGGTGVLTTLTPLVAPGATRGVAASLSADDDGLELAVRSALDPEREKASPGFFAAFPQFQPALAEKLRPETLAYLAIGSPQQTISSLLGQATAQAPGIASGFQDLVDELRRHDNVDIEGQLLDALGDEAGFAVEPGAEAQAPGQAAAPPYLLFAADGVDEDQARKALAALEAPLADAVHAGSEGQAPVFGQQEVAGVQTNSLRVSPAVELTYAVFDGLAAIATDPAGVAGLIEGDGGLDERPLYQRATDGFPDDVALLAYLDLGGLVTTAEQAGLAEDPRYVTFAGDIRRLEALGVAVSDSDNVLGTDLRLLVSASEPQEGASTTLAPGGE